MDLLLIITAAIIFTCIFLNDLTTKIGIPVLLLFILFGLISGYRFENVMTQYGTLISHACTVALIFVMFYGGFGTRWAMAKPVIREAGLLASLGVIITAASVGVFCYYVLGWKLFESFLMGSVICSTDAASVFNILRTHNLGLKKRVAPILEVESGSNDPFSYMLTAIFISVIKGTATGHLLAWTVFSQIFFGLVFGAVIAQAATHILKRIHFTHSGFDTLFIFALAIVAYAIPSACGGNGFLSVYIVGIVVGNMNFPGRKQLISFFDAVTDLMQIVIFFLLGFMAIGSKLVEVIPIAVTLFVFISLVARPLAVFSILTPFRKYNAKTMGFISFVGLRGAASIVFAIMTVTDRIPLDHDIFSIVFVIVLISIAGQGSLIPMAAKLFKVTDPKANDLKTFSDFTDNEELSFGKVKIRDNSPWNGKSVADLNLPRDIILVRVLRGKEGVVPDGQLVLETGDTAIVATRAYVDSVSAKVRSVHMTGDNKWIGSTISDYSLEKDVLTIMVKRGDRCIIPVAHTHIKKGDILLTVSRHNTN